MASNHGKLRGGRPRIDGIGRGKRVAINIIGESPDYLPTSLQASVFIPSDRLQLLLPCSLSS